MSFSFIKRKVFLTLLTLAFSAFMVGNAFSQSGTSRITGTVTDQTGAAVPGATVTITNPATGFTKSATTNDDGDFSFPGIPPARYNMSVEAGGFKKSVVTAIRALVDSTIVKNVPLEPGDVTATVDVTSNTIESVVNTQDASLGNNFVPQQITQLPTNLRRVNDLLSLQPGVTRDGYVAGGRSDQANITLDGIDINDQQNGGRTLQFQTSQGSVLRATTESVEEFRITTTNANASQGRSSGAQISLVTRSGTNDFSGSAFYFYRPTAFSANNFFNNRSIDPATGESVARPSLARHVFGGRLGGPIVRDKFFFFYTYEGQRQTLGQSVNRVVPLPHLGTGEIRFAGTGPSCVNGQCVVGLAELNSIFSELDDLGGGMRLNQTALNALSAAAAAYPSNNTDVGDGVNTGGFRFNAQRDIKENTHIGRLDYHINDNHQLFARGNYQWDNSTGTSQFPDTIPTRSWSHPTGFVFGHDWTISGNKINNLRFGLTRQAFSNTGDSEAPAITFRFVFSPRLFARTLERVTNSYNLTDNFTWIKGNHSVQMGGSFWHIRNMRSSLGSSFDSAVTNPSFYNLSGRAVSNEFLDAGYTFDGTRSIVQNAATAVIGRYSQYAGNYTYDIDGALLPEGTAAERNFGTESIELYVQDSWKLLRNLTLTFGVRFSTASPVYETNGFQVVPEVPLGEIFEKRAATAQFGVPSNDLVNFVLGGSANNAPGFYERDYNWQPKVAFAWSPNFENGFLNKIFGDEGTSTIRGGFAITNDYFGQQLAVSFDGLSTLGFTTTTRISANTYNVTSNQAPLFTGFDQAIRNLPGVPPIDRFMTPADESQRIETSLDATIQSPKHYTWNLSYGRSLPKGMYFEASYIGRKARNLFATRDVMALNNIVDPTTGMDFYTAFNTLLDARQNNVPFDQIPEMAYWDNLFPNALTGTTGFLTQLWGGCTPTTNTQAVYGFLSRDCVDIGDWTFAQLVMDDDGRYPNMFYHPQYAAFSAYGTTAKSDYHGGTFSLRQRLGETLTYDINYTFSKSMDNASGLQTGGSYGSQFILNPLRPDDNYSVSDFDVTHLVNANFIFQLPFGKGRSWFSGANGLVDAFIGGWQLAGVYRFNTGQPFSPPFDAAQWATNWNVQSNGTLLRPVEFTVNRETLNVFPDPQAALNSFRNARAGETGGRNIFRLPGYQTLDLGLSKSFTMPWSETHKFQFRWEVFNVTNVQYLNAGNITRTTWGLPVDPETETAAATFGQVYDRIQGSPRAMQFGVSYRF